MQLWATTLVLLLVGLTWPNAEAQRASRHKLPLPANCSESDTNLHQLWSAMCLSISDPASCPGADNVTAEHDWPNQASVPASVNPLCRAPVVCGHTPSPRTA